MFAPLDKPESDHSRCNTVLKWRRPLLWLAKWLVQKPSEMMSMKGVIIKGLVRKRWNVQKQLFLIPLPFKVLDSVQLAFSSVRSAYVAVARIVEGKPSRFMTPITARINTWSPFAPGALQNRTSIDPVSSSMVALNRLGKKQPRIGKEGICSRRVTVPRNVTRC